MTFGPAKPNQASSAGASPRAVPPPPQAKSLSAGANSTASSVSTAARSPPANGAITPSTFSKTAPCSRCSAAPRKSRSTASKKIRKLARRQGAYSVISATGLIVRRGHELDRVLRAIDPLRWWRACVSAGCCRRLRVTRGGVVAPVPSARCISTRVEPAAEFEADVCERADIGESRSALCTPIEAACAESPITAIICRKPRAVQRLDQLRQQRACRCRGDACRARHRPNPRRVKR